MATSSQDCGDVRLNRNVTNFIANIANRNQEIIPVGAWVQPATEFCPDASKLASKEEKSLLYLQKQKATQLKKFQNEVKFRVHAMKKMRQQQLLHKTFKDVLSEQHFINQRNKVTEKCKLRSHGGTSRYDPDITIGKGLTSDLDIFNCKHFLEQMKQVHVLNYHARKCLATKHIILEGCKEDYIPECMWENSSTLRNVSLKRILEDECAILKPSFEDNSANAVQSSKFECMPDSCNVYPIVQSKVDQIQLQQQRAMYRHLFMALEREQVKENLRQKKNQEKMALLKKVKESERIRIEQLMLQFTDPVDFPTAQTQTLEECQAKDMMQKDLLQLSQNEHMKWKQKSKEIERFLFALKKNIQDKMEKQKIDLPQLCCCGTSLWDTSPITCANNCAFYQNPLGYAKALKSLLASYVAA